jgi:hypothetical protein
MGKIDLSKLKELAGGVGSLRAYSSLLWPVVIVFAGLLVLAAALLMGSNLRQKVNNESIQLATKIEPLLETAPALRQAEEEKKYEDTYEQDANLIARLAIQTTERELLDYNIFPQPKDTSALLFTRYANSFRQQIEKLTARVKGLDCPSEEELKVSVQKVSDITRTRVGALITTNNAQDCWFWQLGYWITEDVFSTVESMNAGSSSVYSSPVKRIIGIGFVTPDKLFVTGNNKTPQDKPKYVAKPEDQVTESLTGRISNDEIDVLHFSVVVVVNADAIIPFMKELCSEKEHRFFGYTGNDAAKSFKHNQISILESRARFVSPESPEHLHYRYGQGTAAEVELVCEYIFNKKGYEPIYPEVMKKKAEPTAGATN